MISNLPAPAIVFIIGALISLLFKNKLKQIILLLIPALGFYLVWNLTGDSSFAFSLSGLELNMLKVDKLSKVFGYIFCIASFGSFLFALHVKENLEHFSALIYVGSALGVVFAGDFISLYIFWEFMAFSSVMLILARKTKKASDAGFRYLLIHVVGGLVLLAGILLQYSNTGSFAITHITSKTISSYLILIGFLINAAVPPLSAWMSDAYPESTATGGVFLSAFTTKTAVYVLLRTFYGWDILIYLGAAMTIYGIIFAIMENDARRILAYSIMNQVGFMIVGIGIGTQMSMNGAAAHAFAHIIYKGLLWMSAGSVLYMTGKTKCTDLGGLYKTMPVTLVCCCIAAAAISAFPLTSGFTTKTMILQSSINQHFTIIYIILEIASAGVFLHAGVKFPYFVFFAKDKGLRASDPKKNMQIAMIFFAVLCIAIGVYPKPLYNILPYAVDYNAYTGDHVVSMLQLLLFSGLAFFVFLGLLKRTETITLDTDWFYRKGVRLIVNSVTYVISKIAYAFDFVFIKSLPAILAKFTQKPLSAIAGFFAGIIKKEPFYSGYAAESSGPEWLTIIAVGPVVLVSVIILMILAGVLVF
ncbi:MAG: Na(+)/H(+) antiporter subunit D [Spirochaetes bacterium]|nr:Na(+)/H(+) antiporter subunit D [Spirochaetota bacterium]